MDFLREVNAGTKVDAKGKRAIVIGGGNVAMDAARVSWREGFDEVHILYRRTKKEMPASPWEIDAAEHEGINIQYLVAPIEVVGKDGKMTGLKCLRMQLGEPDASGRRRPVPIEGSEFVVEAEVLIPAIGQPPDLTFVPEGSGLNITRWQTFGVDKSNYMTNVPGVFSAGNVKTGPDIAIRACAGGGKAARGIIGYLEARRQSSERKVSSYHKRKCRLATYREGGGDWRRTFMRLRPPRSSETENPPQGGTAGNSHERRTCNTKTKAATS